jgi:Double-GTPase 2
MNRDHTADAGAIAEAGALYGPERLNADEASRLLAQGPGRLVVWVGEPGSGRTTLTAQLYEHQRQPELDPSFAGSWTLLAFEEMLHSRERHPEELDGGRALLHLALSAGGRRVHLLIADLPGEPFSRLADNQLTASEIPWLRRADKLVLLVDGARLCLPETRGTAVTRMRQLLERIAADGLPAGGGEVALAVTKWDLVWHDAGARAYWLAREEDLLAELRAHAPAAGILRVAAEAEPGALDDDGVAELRTWLLSAPQHTLDPPLPRYAPPAGVPAALRSPWRRAA